MLGWVCRMARKLRNRPFKIKSWVPPLAGIIPLYSHMKPPLSFCFLVLCLTSLSCERHAELKREITALEVTFKQDEAATLQYDKDIAALGGREGLNRILQQTQINEAQLRPLEFVNAPRERKLTAIETEFAKLKPAAEAFKAAQPK